MRYDRDPKYLHPYIHARLDSILDAIKERLPVNHVPKLVSAHRTPADQFELYKQGRTFKNGSWIKTGDVVTNLDGYIKLSRHNFLACTAFDVGLFKNDDYLKKSDLYQHVYEGTKHGMDWGGNWITFKDQPHLEIPPSQFFKGNIHKDCSLIWQQYLVKAGNYTGALDGIFGPESSKALKAATGEESRSLKAWNILFEKFGVMKNYLDE